MHNLAYFLNEDTLSRVICQSGGLITLPTITNEPSSAWGSPGGRGGSGFTKKFENSPGMP